ncbi:MAG: hypothetical protein HYT80_05650 [Euryarchaeota archaeon]|nr:hypothetical protein [Euryarchaeota archaeon]
MGYSGGTWRRLKIAAEVRAGHGIPKVLPRDELLRLLGLILGIGAGRAEEVLGDENAQLREGVSAWNSDRAGDLEALRAHIAAAAARIDVRGFL